jgi:hypothetical protein
VTRRTGPTQPSRRDAVPPTLQKTEPRREARIGPRPTERSAQGRRSPQAAHTHPHRSPRTLAHTSTRPQARPRGMEASARGRGVRRARDGRPHRTSAIRMTATCGAPAGLVASAETTETAVDHVVGQVAMLAHSGGRLEPEPGHRCCAASRRARRRDWRERRRSTCTR